jgi:hypothetical protein
MRYILYSIGKICNLHSLKSYLHLFYYNINGFLKNLNRVFYPHSAGLADPGEPEGRRVFADCKKESQPPAWGPHGRREPMWTFQALISDLNPKGRWLRSREDGI